MSAVTRRSVSKRSFSADVNSTVAGASLGPEGDSEDSSVTPEDVRSRTVCASCVADADEEIFPVEKNAAVSSPYDLALVRYVRDSRKFWVRTTVAQEGLTIGRVALSDEIEACGLLLKRSICCRRCWAMEEDMVKDSFRRVGADVVDVPRAEKTTVDERNVVRRSSLDSTWVVPAGRSTGFFKFPSILLLRLDAPAVVAAPDFPATMLRKTAFDIRSHASAASRARGSTGNGPLSVAGDDSTDFASVDVVWRRRFSESADMGNAVLHRCLTLPAQGVTTSACTPWRNGEAAMAVIKSRKAGMDEDEQQESNGVAGSCRRLLRLRFAFDLLLGPSLVSAHRQCGKSFSSPVNFIARSISLLVASIL